jgi:thioredoxin 1
MSLLEFTDANFQREVLDSDKPVLVDFWAVWCGPCKAVAPLVEEIAREYGTKIKVGKLDVGENPDVPLQYSVRNIPTLLVFKEGRVVEQIVGTVPKGNLVKMLAPHLGVAA